MIPKETTVDVRSWITPYASLFQGHMGALEICLIIFGTIGNVIIGLCYIPQLITTFKTRGTTGLSLTMWIFVIIGASGFIIWGIMYVVQGAIAKNNLSALVALGYINLPSGMSNNQAFDLLKENWNNGGSWVIEVANKKAVAEGIIDGLVAFVFTSISLVISLMILFIKIKNVVLAKKYKITEAQLCEELYLKHLEREERRKEHRLINHYLHKQEEGLING